MIIAMGDLAEPRGNGDLIGYPLEEAKAALANLGISPSIVQETEAPKTTASRGQVRVVRQRLNPEGKVELVVAEFLELESRA